MCSKIVLCGTGFLGSNIAKALLTAQGVSKMRVQISSRHPHPIHAALEDIANEGQLLPPVPVDVTKASTLISAFQDADVVVSMVGKLTGSPRDFEEIQWKGAENIARAAQANGAKLIHFSAIGADINSQIPYAKTKALGEKAVLEICPDATIVRPSLVFGPGDGFFNRFARLSQYLPFLPVFGGGRSLFQPVFVGDIARAAEIMSREDKEIRSAIAGKIIEAGGPDIFTYREIMELVLQYSKRWRPIVSLPFAFGIIQGAIMEQLPETLFTVTRSQIEQLKSDNVVSDEHVVKGATLQKILEKYDSSPLTSVHKVLPTYL